MIALLASLVLAGPSAHAEDVHLEVSTGHASAVICAVDGAERRVTLDQDGAAIVWHRASGGAVGRWHGPTTGLLQRTSCAATTHDGRAVFVAGNHAGVHLIDLSTGARLAEIDLPGSGDARVHALGSRILAWIDHGTGLVLLGSDGREIASFAGDQRIAIAALIPDDQVVLATMDNRLQRWSVRGKPRLLGEIALPEPTAAEDDLLGVMRLGFGARAIGADGEGVLALGADGRVWRWADGADGLTEAVVLPDANQIQDALFQDARLAWITNGTLGVWTAADGVRTWATSGRTTRVAFIDGEPAALGGDGAIEQAGPKGQVRSRSRKVVHAVRELAVHDEHIAVVQADLPLVRWPLDGGPPVRGRADRHPVDVLPHEAVALVRAEPEDPTKAFVDELTLEVLDLHRGEVLQTFELEGVQSGARFRLLSRDLVGVGDSGGTVLDVRSGEMSEWKALDRFFRASGHGDRALVSHMFDGVRVLDLESRAELVHVPKLGAFANDLVGDTLTGVSQDGRLFHIDVKTEQVTESTPPWGFDGSWLSLAVRPADGLVALGSTAGPVLLWDGEVAMEESEWGPVAAEDPEMLVAHAGPVTTLAWVGDRLITGGEDGAIHIWDAKAGGETPRCSLYSFSDGTWAVVDREGRYDASSAGDIAHLHWVVDGEPVSLDQLKARYWHPGLLGACTGKGEVSLRDVQGLDRVALHPKVDADIESGRLKVTINARSGGIGPVIVRLNGKEIAADLRAVGARGAGPGDVNLVLDVEDSPLVQPGSENIIEVFAANADGSLVSRGVQARFQAAGERRDPRLRALVVGTADYAGDGLDLRYSGRDAVAFANALRAGGKALFDDADVTLLSTESGHPRPTRKAVEDALVALAADARPEDVVVVYFAGHGVVSPGSDGELQILLADAWTADVSDPAVRERVALSSRRLSEILASIPAAKQVLVLDTCHSGKVVDDLTAARAVPGDQVRALDRMKDRAGLFVLAGASADAVSYEAFQYGQGLLTYSLLSGMRGAALREGTLWDVGGLFAYASDRVPELARGVGGVQQPVVAIPRGGGSFDIGRATPAVKETIQLAKGKPVVLRTNFQDDVRFDDSLGLAERVDTALRDRSGGVTAPFVFIDGRGWDGGLVVAGRYRKAEVGLVVELRVLRGEDVLASETVKGADADAVSKAVAATVERVAAGK